jgi:multicomponent K+:H+ antiporter subunit D
MASVSVIGMPPLSGFVGKVLLLQAATGQQAVWLWAVVLTASLAVMTALSRSGSTIFWRTRNVVAEAPKADIWSLSAIIGLMTFSLALMLWGNDVINYAGAIAEQVLNPDIYIRAVLEHRPQAHPLKGN